MKENNKSDLTKIANIINEYVTKETNSLEELENLLQKIFNVERVKFWKFDQKLDALKAIDKEELSVTLESSLTEQLIQKKEVLISDHITSDKYYSPHTDNPFEFKVKAMLALPLFKGKKILGVVKLWKGLKQRKNFTKDDVALLESFAPFFIHLMENEVIEKDELLKMTGEDENDAAPSRKDKKEDPVASASQQDNKKSSSMKNEFDALEEKYNQLLQENEALEKEKKDKKKEEKRLLDDLKKVDQLKSDIEEYQNKAEEYKAEVKEYKKLLKQYEERSKSLEDNATETIDGYLQRINKLEEQVGDLNDENKILKSELKEEKTKHTANSIENTKKKLFEQSKQDSFMDKNIEFLFQEVDEVFCDHECTYLLLEDIIYALKSKKDIDLIEDKLRNTKLLYDLIDNNRFLGTITVNAEKFLIANLVKKLEKYDQKVFAGAPKLNVAVDEQMPTSLVMDAPKIQNIIFHLLIDLYHFIDQNKPMDIGLLYQDKTFQIALSGAVQKKNTLFKAMLNQTHLGKEKDRLSLQMAKKLIKIVGGDIEADYGDSHYKYNVSLPVQVIKLV
jgi:hypothetical protein